MDFWSAVLGATAAIVGAVVGGLIVAVSAFKVKKLEIRAQVDQWKLERRDATYALLAEWLAENWMWARELHHPRVRESTDFEPSHANNLQAEVMLRLHCSRAVDSLFDAYGAAMVQLLNARTCFHQPDAFFGDRSTDPLRNLLKAQEGLRIAGDAITNQMASELRPEEESSCA